MLSWQLQMTFIGGIQCCQFFSPQKYVYKVGLLTGVVFRWSQVKKPHSLQQSDW